MIVKRCLKLEKNELDKKLVWASFTSPRRRRRMKYNVKLTWDKEANVWVATSDDIPGLVLESNSYDALIEKVKIASPELLELNII